MMTNFEKPSLNELAHFGKKGMKWGVRKDRSIGSSKNRRVRGDIKGSIDIPKQLALSGAAAIGGYMLTSKMIKLSGKTISRGEKIAFSLVGGQIGMTLAQIIRIKKA